MFTLSINIILNTGFKKKKRKGVDSNVQLLLNPLSVTKTAGVPACLLFMYLFIFYLFNLFCGIVLYMFGSKSKAVSLGSFDK